MSGAQGRGDPGGRRTLAALAHPIRVGVLAHLRSHEIASPTEIADALDLPLGKLSYHVRRLERLGLIELVERRQRRGTIQHYYVMSEQATANAVVRQATGMLATHPDASHAGARALLDATAIGDLRADLDHLFARMRALEAEAVQRAGVGRHALTFAVDVSCAIDVEPAAHARRTHHARR